MNRAQRRKLKKGQADPRTIYAGGAVACACGDSFTPHPEERLLPDGGAESSFACPHCLARTVCYRVTARGLELRRELAEYGSARGDAPISERIKKTRELKDALKREVIRG